MATKVKARTKLEASRQKTSAARQAKAPVGKAPGAKAALAGVRMPNLDVERWFATRRLATEKVLRRVRDVILAADSRVTDAVADRTIQFSYLGLLAAFVKLSDAGVVTLKVPNGARIPGKFPHLEGTGRAVRLMRFARAGEVDRRAGELTRLVAAWCQLQDQIRGG